MVARRRDVAAPASHERGPRGGGDLAARVIAWQLVHGRHDLPWQNTRDPYRIWVSEIMLQQTQVAAVLGYFARFLERFPDLASLACADSGEVMRLWSGLGYYSRARNLHRTAQSIASEFGGVFPAEQAVLERLPGIGRSTAAAIVSLSFGRRAAILDGNVKRVFARHFGIEGYPGAAPVEALLWDYADAMLPVRGVAAYTQGLMDLGATLCTRTRPACTTCPLRSSCVAHAGGRTGELPHRKPRTALPRRACVMLLVTERGRVLLERRPPTGIWGGLWSLPEAPSLDAGGEAAARRFAERHGRIVALERLVPFTHGFTHFRLLAEVLRIEVGEPVATHAEDSGKTNVWMSLAEARGVGLPAPVKTLLGALTGSQKKS